MRSSSSWPMMRPIQDGIEATSPASRPSGIDFGCGFHSSRPVGTCSSARRVRAASRSSSARKSSVCFMPSACHGFVRIVESFHRVHVFPPSTVEYTRPSGVLTVAAR